jgi:hypothetical protein
LFFSISSPKPNAGHVDWRSAFSFEDTNMSTVLDDLPAELHTSASDKMRNRMAAARLSFNWMGVRKTLTSEQKTQAADSFDAESKYLSASKKLIDTTHPAYKAVTSVRSRAVAYWKAVSLPYPEPGLRLIKRETIGDFDAQMEVYRGELEAAVAELDLHFAEMRDAARDRLGDLFDASDYPASLVDEFAITHDFPAVEPPNYLRQLNPEVYEAECCRVQSRFVEAVELAEQAFLEELAKLVEHLTERIAGQEDGKPKVFRDSAVTNLNEFFARFRSLNIGSNEQLDQLVSQAQAAVSGVGPQELRTSEQLRQRVSTRMASVQAGLDQLLVDRPRRNIQRRPR